MVDLGHHWLARALLPAALWLDGCGELVGADQYSTADPELPYHGFFDRLGGAACRECVLSKCQGVLDQCAADAQCAEYLECSTRSPGMTRGCVPLSSFESLGLGNAWGGCQKQCAGPCNVGRVWSCQRAFDWPAPVLGVNSAQFNLRYTNQLDGQPLTGLDVQACDMTDIDCITPKSELATTDAQGEATLTVTWPPVSPISPEPGFVGYLELTSKTIEPVWRPLLRFHYRPVVNDYAEWAVLFNANDPKISSLLLAAGIKPELASLSVEVSDCIGASAPGIDFEVRTQPNDALVPMFYLDAGGNPNPQLTETSTSGIAFGGNMVGESARVIARFADTGEVIRAVEFRLRAGASHQIGVPPAAVGE